MAVASDGRIPDIPWKRRLDLEWMLEAYDLTRKDGAPNLIASVPRHQQGAGQGV